MKVFFNPQSITNDIQGDKKSIGIYLIKEFDCNMHRLDAKEKENTNSSRFNKTLWWYSSSNRWSLFRWDSSVEDFFFRLLSFGYWRWFSVLHLVDWSLTRVVCCMLVGGLGNDMDEFHWREWFWNLMSIDRSREICLSNVWLVRSLWWIKMEREWIECNRSDRSMWHQNSLDNHVIGIRERYRPEVVENYWKRRGEESERRIDDIPFEITAIGKKIFPFGFFFVICLIN